MKGETVLPDRVILCQIAIPVMSVTHIKKTKTAILVPNALVVATANDKVRRSDQHQFPARKPRSDPTVLLLSMSLCPSCPETTPTRS